MNPTNSHGRRLKTYPNHQNLEFQLNEWTHFLSKDYMAKVSAFQLFHEVLRCHALQIRWNPLRISRVYGAFAL